MPIVEKDGKPAVPPSEATVLDGTYQPLARPIFIYVSTKSMAKPEVKEFVEYYLAHGAKLSKEVKYVPLPDRIYKAGMDRLSKMQKGTVFAGHADVGVKIDDLFARPLVLVAK